MHTSHEALGLTRAGSGMASLFCARFSARRECPWAPMAEARDFSSVLGSASSWPCVACRTVGFILALRGSDRSPGTYVLG